MIRMADRPVMPSNPCEKLPGSNRIVVSEPDPSANPARRQEWPKCVSCMAILLRQAGAEFGGLRLRMLMAAMLAAWGMSLVAVNAQAQPLDCPPNCDRIPDSAWIAPTSIPLYDAYRWPGLAALAVTATAPRFRFEEACNRPPVLGDARAFAVAAKAAAGSPDGQWHLQAQVMHWRGDTWQAGQTAMSVFDAGVAALRSCQMTSPLTSPSLTTREPDRLAAVISAPGPSVIHEYLVVDKRNSTITELALWSMSQPAVGWPVVADAGVLDAMTMPLCAAYIGSCQ